MRRSWWALFLFVGCTSDPTTDPMMPDPDPVPDGLCRATLTYRATASTPEVFVAGEFNGFEPVTELVDDGSGVYRTDLDLAPGIYAYKLVVEGDGQEPWRLDPAHAYRAYRDGIENSALRVEDCFRPTLEVETTSVGADSFEASVRYDPRRAAALGPVEGELRNGQSTRPLSASELLVDGDTIRVNLAGLADGKYTVRLTATDTDGAASEPRLLPFWIEAEPFAWGDAIIYMIMTDRFRDGAPENNRAPANASGGAEWTGGDLQGVTQAIRDGYLTDLGVNTLWLTPFNQNPEGAYADADDFHQVTGYHGYWPTDPLRVDPAIGGDEALLELVATAHEHGIRILMDLVVNHVHEGHPYATEHPSWLRTGCVCGTEACDWTAQRLECLFRPYMPDVDWTNEAASERFIADALAWLERFDLDGFRIDAVKHVEDIAVTNLATRVREEFETTGTEYFLMGETAMGWDPSSGPAEGGNLENYGTISRYIGDDALDGQFDFVLYYAAALQFLNDEPGRGMAHIDFWTQASMAQYPGGAIMTPYLGSHDTPRFMTLSAHPQLAGNKWDNLPPAPDSDDPYDRMYAGFAWMFAIPGAPLLYYGDEYGEYGAADPDNRHPMRFAGERSMRETRQADRVSALVQARRALPGLRSTDYESLLATETVWAVARGTDEELVLVLLNAGGGEETVTVPVPLAVAAEGALFEDALDPSFRVSVRGGAIDAGLVPRSARYLRLIE
ncbi:MAG: alpha-amylase family glycosyl hydrolase [Myxococcota bacterium]